LAVILRRRRQPPAAGLSFLDCICCGFGAVILLLVIVKTHQPTLVVDLSEELRLNAEHLRAVLADLLDETGLIDDRLASVEDAAASQRLDLERAQKEWEQTLEDLAAADVDEDFLVRLQEIYARAQESTPRKNPPTSLVGGVPADSEYIIFIIDTSGSMVQNSWDLVVQKMQETLDVYPKVRGIQIYNDMGRYMFSGYAGKWIPDTRAGRKLILSYLENWRAFSNSSPVEGITEAMKTYARNFENISIYVFGDEFTGNSIQHVVDTVDRLNRRRTVRIHAIGFPWADQFGNLQPTALRFATLMRVLCQRNGGTFVALQGH
jgi:hypothetical protein